MTTTLNLSYQSKPWTVPQGGTNETTATTAYGLILGGTTSTGAFQNGGTGTTNQAYVSGGASAAGTWTGQNAIGCWTLISTNTPSAAASSAFTGLSTSYVAYRISISGLVPANNAVNLLCRVSSNNGSSYDSGAGNYGYSNLYVNDSGTAAANTNVSTSATAIQIGKVWSSTSFGNNFDIVFVDPDTSLASNGIFWSGYYSDSTSAGCWCNGEGSRLATQANNAIQFLFSSGNITSGTLKLYGLKT